MNNLQKIFLINQQITTIGNTGNVTKIRENKEYIPFLFLITPEKLHQPVIIVEI